MIEFQGRGPALLVLGLMLSACAGDGSAGGDEWAGTVRDSAGVQVVANPGDGVWSDAEGWRADEALRIGAIEGAPEYQFGQIRSLDVDEQGRIYVLDGLAQKVNVYDAEGTYVSTIGTPGNGPGQLSAGATAVFIDDGELLVPDMGTQRMNIFGLDGEFLRSWRLGFEQGLPIRWDHDGSGRLVAQLRSFDPSEPAGATQPIVVYSDSGAVMDTLATLPKGQSMTMTASGPRIRVFAPEPAWETLPGGGIVTAMSDDYRLELSGPDGSLERVVTLARQAKPIGEGGKARVKEMLREEMETGGMPAQAMTMMLQNMEIADQYPLFATLLAGPDGTIWVQRVQPIDEAAVAQGGGGTANIRDLGSPEWDVIGEDGRYLGVVTLPERFQPVRFVGNELYGIWRDPMDVQYVLKLRLTRPGETDA